MNFPTLVACLCKAADIPEVQAVIRILEARILARLRLIRDDALLELIRRLEAFSDRTGNVDIDLLARLDRRRREETLVRLLESFESTVVGYYASFISDELRRDVEDGLDELLLFARRDDSLPTLPEEDRQDFILLGTLELERLIQSTLDREKLRDLIRTYLTTRSARLPGSPGAGPDAPISREAWLEQVKAVLLPENGVARAVDAWGYRQTNVASFRAGRAAGYQLFQVVAVLDERTTSFCRWAHGRLVPVTRVLAQLNADGPPEEVWPFIDRGAKSELAFEKFFRRVGGPPYHFGCRSRLRPVQLGR